MQEKVKLKILGLTYSQTQTGSYALVLAEENGDRRIPIMIGAFEAQAIALHLEELNPPRPLTHDLFKSFSTAYGISLKEVVISKLSEGVFYSVLYFFNGEDVVMIDSRTSDAVALALRFKCPIYTSREILDKAGIVLDEQNENKDEDKEDGVGALSKYSMDELKEMLQVAVESEDYEKASDIRDEISSRQEK